LRYNSHMILGIDEVGRGPWAGPLVVGAVVLGGAHIEGLTDSKKLTKKRREILYDEIQEKASGIGLGWVTAKEIDEIGLSAALKLATKRAVQEVKAPFHEVIIDGTINFLAGTPLERYVKTMPKADLLVPSVSAASIVAKVSRDRYMATQDAIYDGYAFGSHAGYGTAVHRSAIELRGVTPLHRLSFAPLAKYRATPEARNLDESNADKQVLRTSKKIGDMAEDEAANYLVRLGHEIIDRNWKTKYCEIDIVSRREDTLYFTEVKYRSQPNQGGGLAAITPKKLNQMRYAAKLYAHSNKISNMNLTLSAISLSGTQPAVEQYIAEV
jgi:ribonuclease HII